MSVLIHLNHDPPFYFANKPKKVLLGSPCFTPELNSIGESNLEFILIRACVPLYINLLFVDLMIILTKVN